MGTCPYIHGVSEPALTFLSPGPPAPHAAKSSSSSRNPFEAPVLRRSLISPPAGVGPTRVCGSSELRWRLRNQVLPPQHKSSVTGEEADHPGWPRARTQAQEPGPSGESWLCHRAAVELCESPRAVITNGHKRGGLKQQDFILSVLEARSLKSRHRQGWLLLGAPRDSVPHALCPAPGGFLKSSVFFADTSL